jgi:hypothetical protein
LRAERQGVPPDVQMDDHYKLVDSIESIGMPSLVGCHQLKVQGLVSFAEGVIIEGDVSIHNSTNERQEVPAGIYRDKQIAW